MAYSAFNMRVPLEFPSLKIGGANDYAQFDSTGHMTFHGLARPWRDELGDALNLKIQGVGLSLNTAEGCLEFVHAADMNDYAYRNIQLNHDKDLSGGIDVHFHWWQAENAVPNMMLQYRWQSNLAAKVTAWTNVKCVTPAHAYVSGTLNQIYGLATPIMPPADTALSDIVQIRLIRDHGNVSGLFTGDDPYAGVVQVTSLDCHEQLNSVGSTDEYTK